MENASKALIMAAGVLIGILILSLAIYLFANFGAASAEVHRQNEANQINQFNAQFTSYEGRTDITIHDVVTVANLAKDSNANYELTSQTETNYYIIVKLGNNQIQNYTSSQLDNLVSNDVNSINKTSESLPTYTCNVIINPNTKRVSTVNFTLNK